MVAVAGRAARGVEREIPKLRARKHVARSNVRKFAQKGKQQQQEKYFKDKFIISTVLSSLLKQYPAALLNFLELYLKKKNAENLKTQQCAPVYAICQSNFVRVRRS